LDAINDKKSISDDSSVWFAVALKQYVEKTKDKSFEKYRKKLLKVKSNTGITWMDSLIRENAFELPWLYKRAGKKVNNLRLKNSVNLLFLIYLDFLETNDQYLHLLENNFTTIKE